MDFATVGGGDREGRRDGQQDWHIRFVPVDTGANAQLHAEDDPAELATETSFALEDLLAVDEDEQPVGVQIGRLRRKADGLKGMMINNALVSREHAEVWVDHDGYPFLRDTTSLHGTWRSEGETMLELPTQQPIALKHSDQIRFGKSLNPDDCPPLFRIELKHPDVYSPTSHTRKPDYHSATSASARHVATLASRIRQRVTPAPVETTQTHRYGLPQSLLYDDEDDKPFERTRSGSAVSAVDAAPKINVLDLLKAESEPLVVPSSPAPRHATVDIANQDGVLSQPTVPLPNDSPADEDEGPEVRGLYDVDNPVADLPGMALYRIFAGQPEEVPKVDEQNDDEDHDEHIDRCANDSTCAMSEHISDPSDADQEGISEDDVSEGGSMNGHAKGSSSFFGSGSERDSEISRDGWASEHYESGSDYGSEASYDSVYDYHRDADREIDSEGDQDSLMSDPDTSPPALIRPFEFLVPAAGAEQALSSSLSPEYAGVRPVSLAHADSVSAVSHTEVVISFDYPSESVRTNNQAEAVPASLQTQEAVQAPADVVNQRASSGELQRIMADRLEQELADSTTYGDTSAFSVTQKLRAQAEVALDKARGKDPVPIPAPDAHLELAPPAVHDDFVLSDWMQAHDRPRTPSLAESDRASVSEEVLVTPPINNHKRKLSEELAEEMPATPSKKAKEARKGRDFGMVLLGAAIGAVGTIAGLLQMAE